MCVGLENVREAANTNLNFRLCAALNRCAGCMVTAETDTANEIVLPGVYLEIGGV